MAFPAFFDTNAIFGGALNDVLLTLANPGLFRPLWSTGVLDELQRNLLKRGINVDARAIVIVHIAFGLSVFDVIEQADHDVA